jgi:hypothetical protein
MISIIISIFCTEAMSARYGRSHPGKSKASTAAAVESYYQEGVQAAANGEMQMSLMMCVVQTFFFFIISNDY